MASLNRVELIGSLGQDPELRYTPTRVPVVTMSVATTSVINGSDGERQEKTEWHRVVAWNKQAENCAQYLTKGRQVFVEGRLHTRTWEDKNGSTHYTTEIIASRVQFLGKPRHEDEHEAEPTQPAPQNREPEEKTVKRAAPQRRATPRREAAATALKTEFDDEHEFEQPF